MYRKTISMVVAGACAAVLQQPLASARPLRSHAKSTKPMMTSPDDVPMEKKSAEEPPPASDIAPPAGTSAPPPAEQPARAAAAADSSRMQPVPRSDGQAGERHPIKGLLIGGTVLFTGTWLITTGVAYGVFGTTETWPSAIPLVGPFIQMAHIHFEDSSLRTSLIALLATSGLWQFAGLGMIIGGAIGRKVPQLARQDISLAPMLGSDRTGLVLLGSF